MTGWRAQIALALWIAAAALYVGGLLLVVGQPWAHASEPLWLTASFGFASIGGLLSVRRPGNRIGALFLGAGGLLLLQAVCVGYAARALVGGAALPGANLVAWLSLWVEVPGIIALLVFLPLLFPDGRLLSPRWRPVAWAGGVLAVVAAVALAIDPAPGFFPRPDVPFTNPFAVPALASFSAFMRDQGFTFVPLVTLAALASLALRMRRAAGVERLQIKWFAYAFLLATLYILVGWVLLGVVLRHPGHWLLDVIGIAFLLAIPGSVAVAVLRYRLYDIDRIISRTLAYVVLTAVLLGVYGAVVLLLAPVVGRGSDVAVAGATLAAAALFQPLRRRVQAVVDRRFNRSRYDAQRTVEAFALRLRDEIDLQSLNAELGAVVRASMQPRSVSLWIRRREGRA